jgi:RHS repeat-associated protein
VVTKVDVTVANAGTLAASCGNSTQRLVKTWTAGGKTESTRLYLPGGSGRAVVEKLTTAAADATELRYISRASRIIAIESSDSGLLYVVRDQNNSIRLLLNASGSEEGAFDYSPFGSTTASGDDAGSVPYHYTGQEEDKETGLYNYRGRLYDPATLRFISPDPMNQYASPYVYVGNNPIQYNDPSGNFNWHEFADIATIVVLTANPATGSAALIGGAIAGIGYGINMAASHKKFEGTHFLDAIAGGEVGAVEIEAGVALDIATDGAAADLGSNALIGAGFSGLAYSSMAGNAYDWKDYAATEAAGAVTGLISGGFGMLGDAAFGATESATIGWTARIGLRFTGGFLGSATGQAASLGIQGDSGSEVWRKMTSPASIEGDVITGTFAAGAAGVQRLADGPGPWKPLFGAGDDEEEQVGWSKKFLGELKGKGIIKASDTRNLNIPAILGKKTFQGIGQISKKFVWAYLAQENTGVKSKEW